MTWGGAGGTGRFMPTPDGFSPYDADWHRQALGLTLAAGGLRGLDHRRIPRGARSGCRIMRSLSYYEKWIAALADLVVDKGLVTHEELAGGRGCARAPLVAPGLSRVDKVAPALARGTPYTRPGPEPLFAVGERLCGRARLPGNALVTGGPYAAAGLCGGQGRAGGSVARLSCLSGQECPWIGRGGRAALCGRLPGGGSVAAMREGAGDEVILDLWQSYLGAT